ncbi:MAG: hypothetical protein V4638_02235 [Bacteroidota bacterium]
MLKRLLLLLFLSGQAYFFAQNNNVGINTATPDPTAILHLESTTQGLLVPRLSVVERDAIAAPATGLIIYQTDDNQEEIYNGTCWIPSYLKECDDCGLDMNIVQSTYNIDRMTTMTATIPVTITQSSPSGTAIPVNMAVVHTFTEETAVTLSQYNFAGGTTTININVSTNVFENGGTHYVTLFAFCNNTSIAKSIQINVQACDIVNITTNQNNYNLSSAASGNNCIVVNIQDNVGIRSTNATNPAFTTGTIPAGCNIGILNEGYVFGKGGNAPALMGQNAQNGGTAFQLGCNAEIRNKGMIYGGGGAGLTVGAFSNINLGPFSLCIAAGAGGGGGMPDGQGGGSGANTCSLLIGFWTSGNNAGSFYDDNEGAPVNQTLSTPFNVGPVQGAIVITAQGGGGGDFGEPGTGSAQPINFAGSYLEICLNIPFIGTFCAPIPGVASALNAMANAVNNLFNTSAPGQGGYAIQHSAPVTIPDGNYQTFSIRGLVAN